MAVLKATLNWTNPTTRSNGAPLAQEDISAVEIFDGATKIATLGPNVHTFETEPIFGGAHDFHLVVVDTQGRRSADSNVSTVDVPPDFLAPPNAIADLTAVGGVS